MLGPQCVYVYDSRIAPIHDKLTFTCGATLKAVRVLTLSDQRNGIMLRTYNNAKTLKYTPLQTLNVQLFLRVQSFMVYSVLYWA